MYPQFLASNPLSPNHHICPLNRCSYKTWLYTVQPCPIPLTAPISCTYRSISLCIIMLFISAPSWPLATLVYLCKLLCLKYMLPTHSLLSVQNFTTLLPLSFSPGTSKTPVMPALVLSPIYPFISPRMNNLYPFPTLSRILSMSFQKLSLSSPSPSLGPNPTTTQTIIL